MFDWPILVLPFHSVQPPLFFMERKGTITQQLRGAKVSHQCLIQKLINNDFKASPSDHATLLGLLNAEAMQKATDDLDR